MGVLNEKMCKSITNKKKLEMQIGDKSYNTGGEFLPVRNKVTNIISIAKININIKNTKKIIT